MASQSTAISRVAQMTAENAAAPGSITSNLNPFKNASTFMAIPRMISRAGAFAFFTVPERIDSMLGLQNGGSIIAEATGNTSHNLSSAAASGFRLAQGTPLATGGQAAAGQAGEEGFFSFWTFQQVRSFGGVFTYLTSKWALACVTLVSPESSSIGH